MKFVKFLRTPFLTEHLRWLLLKLNIHTSAANLLHIKIGNLDWNENYQKETKRINDSATDLLHIRKGNLDCCKCGAKTKREK